MVGVIAWFDELGKTDTATAGGKGANLGELTAARGTFASTWVPARSVTVRATAIRKEVRCADAGQMGLAHAAS